MQPSTWRQRVLLCAGIAAWGALSGSCDDEAGGDDEAPALGADAGTGASARDAQAADARAGDASKGVTPPDGVAPDAAAASDAATNDAAATDAAVGPAGDAATSDAATSDAATSDAATSDAAASGAATSDAATSDAATSDAATSDAATSDAATPDAAALTDAAPLADAAADAAIADAALPLDAGPADAGADPDAGPRDAGIDASPVDGGACTLTANTYTIGKTNSAGCNLLRRDSASCEGARTQAGLSGFWLKFSCRVSLSINGSNVVATSDNQPDYKSNYFQTSNVCYEVYTGAIQNPNRLSAQTLTVRVPRTPGGQGGPKMGDVIGMAVNGVAIFGNFAAPGDDIYTEARTFDRCGAHPQNTGKYHYHSEPYAVSQDDANFIGVLLDGSPVYGRRDADGTLPSNLDGTGGHTGTTPDSATPVYHYHVNLQTSTSSGTLGDMQWFLTKGMTYHGAAGSCVTCTM